MTSSRYVVTTFPESWRERYFARESYRHDPVISACIHSVEPVNWKDLASRAELGQRQQRVLDEAREHGLTQGLSVPVHGHAGQFSLVSVTSPENGSNFDKLVEEYQHEVHLMSIYLHSKMQARISQDAAEQINLTSREVECLLWTAHGKTAWEISMILKISEATVNYHLKNAMRKLGVHSKAHASQDSHSGADTALVTVRNCRAINLQVVEAGTSGSLSPLPMIVVPWPHPQLS